MVVSPQKQQQQQQRNNEIHPYVNLCGTPRLRFGLCPGLSTCSNSGAFDSRGTKLAHLRLVGRRKDIGRRGCSSQISQKLRWHLLRRRGTWIVYRHDENKTKEGWHVMLFCAHHDWALTLNLILFLCLFSNNLFVRSNPLPRLVFLIP